MNGVRINDASCMGFDLSFNLDLDNWMFFSGSWVVEVASGDGVGVSGNEENMAMC